MVGSRRFLDVISYDLGIELRLGFPWSEKESCVPNTNGTGGSGDENCGAASKRSLDDVLDTSDVDLGGERNECRVPFVIPDAARGAKNGYVGVSRSRRWPRFGEPGDDRRFICNIGSYKFDELRGPLSEINPGGSSDI